MYFILYFILYFFSFGSTVGYSQLEDYKVSLLHQEQEHSVQELIQETEFTEVKSLPLNLGISRGFYWLKIERKNHQLVHDFLTIGTPYS